MRKSIHKVIANVDSNVCTINPPIDIHQGEVNAHVLLIQLCSNHSKFISIDKDNKLKIEFYLNDNLIESSDVQIEDEYRGRVSYVVGATVTNTPGRYTTYLIINNQSEEVLVKISFIVTVSKSHDFNPNSNEVVMTKEFYEELQEHMENKDIHCDPDDVDRVLRLVQD